MEGSWLIARDWNVPDLHFKEYPWDSKFDHVWHDLNALKNPQKQKQ